MLFGSYGSLIANLSLKLDMRNFSKINHSPGPHSMSLLFLSIWVVNRDARVMWDQRSGRSRGFGFVSFRSQQVGSGCFSSMTGLGSFNWASQGVFTCSFLFSWAATRSSSLLHKYLVKAFGINLLKSWSYFTSNLFLISVLIFQFQNLSGSPRRYV